MPSRMTQESYRPGVSDRTMVGNSATTFAYEFQRPSGAVITANMKLQGWERRMAASSLRGLQGRSATNQNAQAAKEKKEKMSLGLDAAKTLLASSSGRSAFRLTSPCIGLPSRGQRGAVSGDRKQTTYAFVSWRVARDSGAILLVEHN